ncbi:MAG TPA: hypothetical protein DHW82_12105, partial [Spirochaetia bacterium]|nr:hypothetical protein [Spirochaetia bacterium]
MIENYELKELIYESSHSKVYKAVSLLSGQKTALKMIPNQFPQDRNNFYKEIEISKKFQDSKYFVKFLEAFEEDNQFYLITEWIEGSSLMKWKGDPQKMVDFFIQAVEGISLIHQKKLLHCDINLKNMMIDNQECVKYIDFGIAAYKNIDKHINAGTLPYMSPEQLGYIKYPLGNYSDLYSLGVTFYQFFTGKLPFSDEDKNKLIQKILTEEISFAHFQNRNFPVMLPILLKKLLSKNPLDRYQNAQGLLYDLIKLKIQPELVFETGEKDSYGALNEDFEPVGLGEYIENMLRLIDRNLNPAIRGGKKTGKTTLLLHFYEKNKKEKKIIFIDSEKNSQIGLFIQALVEKMYAFFSFEEIQVLISNKCFQAIGTFLPEAIQEKFSNLACEINQETKTYLKIFLAGLLSLLKEKNIILMIDNTHEADEDILITLTYAEEGNLILSFNADSEKSQSLPVQRFAFIDLFPVKEEEIKVLFTQLFSGTLSQEDLAFLTKKFSLSSYFPSEIIENLKILISKKQIRHFPEKNQWVLEHDSILKIDFSGYYSIYLKDQFDSLNKEEILLLKSALYLIEPFNIEIITKVFSLLSGLSSEDAFVFIAERLTVFKSYDFLKLENNSGFVMNATLKNFLINQISLEEEKRIKFIIIEALKENNDEYFREIVYYMKQTLHPESLIYTQLAMDKELKNKNFIEAATYYLFLFDFIESDTDFIHHLKRYFFFRNYIRNMNDLAKIIEKAEIIVGKNTWDDTIKIEIYMVLILYYFANNHFPKTFYYINLLKQLTQNNKNEYAEYLIHTVNGAAHFFSGNMAEAEKSLKIAIQYKSKFKNLDRLAYNHSLLALCQTIMGKKEEALQNAMTGVKLVLEESNLSDMSVCFHFSGFAFSYFGETEKGLEFSQEALHIAKKLRQPILEYSANFSVALGYMMENIFEEAFKHLEACLEISKNFHFTIGLDNVYYILLETLYRQKNKEVFEKYFLQMKELPDSFKNFSGFRLSLLKYQGILYLFYNDYSSAEESLKKALHEAETFNPLEEARISGLLYYIYQELGEYAAATRLFKKAEKIFQNYGLEKEQKFYLTKNIFSSYESSTTSGTLSASSTSLKDSIAYESIMRSTAVISSILEPKKLLKKLMDILFQTFGADKGYIDIQNGKHHYSLSINKDLNTISKDFIDKKLLARSENEKTPFIFDNHQIENNKLGKSILVYPIIHRAHYLGIVYLSNSSITGIFSKEDLKVLSALMNQTSIAIENAVNFLKEKEARKRAENTLKAFQLFVPSQFLNVIAQEGIEKIKLGNALNKEVTILFSDIRDFTSISEKMAPQDLMFFLNSYMKSIMGKNITRYGGFIDKFIGDAVMAIYDGKQSDKAVSSVIEIQKSLQLFNQKRMEENQFPIKMGIGLNSGRVIMGTVGTDKRMDSTVIGDEVNLASRLEGLS